MFIYVRNVERVGGRQNNSRQTSQMIYFGNNNNNVLLTDSCITKTCRQNYVHSTCIVIMACTKVGEHFFMD